MSTEQFEQGLAARRRVMGDEFVQRAFDNASAFSQPLQQFVTENCWGSVWSREGLPDKTRSMITVAMLIALRASNELKGHVRGALRNGCTAEELREVLLHAAVYCGAPAAIEAFRAAEEVIDQWQAEQA